MLGLFIRNGLGKGTYFPLERENRPYVIGRSPDADILLADPGISRRHAEVSMRGGAWVLRDLASRNGTYVNGLPVKERAIQPMDVVVLGSVELLVANRNPMKAVGAKTGRVLSMETHAIASGTPAHSLLGSSAQIREVVRSIERISPLLVSVLIRGETGVGKELVARAVHAGSRRRSGPFVAVNCGAIAGSLLESELFGHEKGAFTGAIGRRLGCFEEASGGTLFLDEIGDLPLPMQAALLRALETKTVRRVGGSEEVPVDVRIIAATHRDLEGMAASGSFREDLYHRLNVIEIRVPPLRERPADIRALAEHFLIAISMELGRPPMRFAGDALAMLASHPWPGNVRELKNAVERAAILAEGGEIAGKDLRTLELADRDDGERETVGSLRVQVARAEKEEIRRALAASGGNKAEAARALGISRMTFYRKLKDLGLS